MHNMKEMQGNDVINIYNLLENNNIGTYIDGGWGIDALLGKQTRTHADLDIAVQHKDILKLRELLRARGYKDAERADAKDYNFVLSDVNGHEIDVHSYTFDSNGNNIYGIAYPADSLTGTGTINGQPVKCIALEWVIKFHENYKPREEDLKDIQALCETFGIKPPENYKNLLK